MVNPCHQHDIPNRDEMSDRRPPMLEEKQKGDNSDDDGNDLSDVGVQLPM
jgi:hypothetical protein